MATRRRSAAAGGATVEMALALPFMLAFAISLLDCAQAVYVWNTAQQITRAAARAAAVTDFADAPAMAQLRRDAMLAGGGTELPLGGGVGVDQLRIEYLWQAADGSLQAMPLLPACPVRNVLNCTRDPNGSDCIRFVRASLCVPGAADCQEVPFQPMIPLPDWLRATVPNAATVARAEGLGYRPGAPMCP